MQGLCPLPCGAPCVRLPCDKRCSRRLACGCLCPSVCGEPCPDPRFCPNHGLPDIMVRRCADAPATLQPGLSRPCLTVLANHPRPSTVQPSTAAERALRSAPPPRAPAPPPPPPPPSKKKHAPTHPPPLPPRCMTPSCVRSGASSSWARRSWTQTRLSACPADMPSRSGCLHGSRGSAAQGQQRPPVLRVLPFCDLWLICMLRIAVRGDRCPAWMNRWSCRQRSARWR
jgi:hypothetical protein